MTNNYTRKSRPAGTAKRATRKARNKRIYQRKSASQQANQIVKLNKRIDSLRDQDYVMKVAYSHQHYDTALTDGVISLCPTHTGSATGVSGQGAWLAWGDYVDQASSSPSDIQSRQRARVGRIYNKLQFTAGTEASPVNYSVYHVRLHPKTAQATVDDLGRNLSTLTDQSSDNNKYYVRGTAGTHNQASMYGNVQLNPSYFIVKKCWQFVLGNTVGTGEGVNFNVSNINSAYKTIDFSFPTNYVIGDTKGLPWASSTPDDLAPELMNFVLIFTDNTATVEGSPTVRSMSTCNITCLND